MRSSLRLASFVLAVAWMCTGVASSAAAQTCEDPARTILGAGSGCNEPGPGCEGCRDFDGDQAACEMAWTIGGNGAASCFFLGGDCEGCGPSNQNAGLCTNTCLEPPQTPSATLLVIDADAIDSGSPPNYFSDKDVNHHRAKLGQRRQLRFFERNIGSIVDLFSGEVGDEGWFALTEIPESWENAGPSDDGVVNYAGVTQPSGKIKVGKGLGRGGDPEALLDEVPGVAPLRAWGLSELVDRTVCAVVQKSDVSINYGPLEGSLKGESLGRVAFAILSVSELTGYSSSSLPRVEIEILDADEVCEGDLELFFEAPEPASSSDPFDVVP